MRFLSARFALARGDFTTEVEFDLPARGAVSLFGASGAGKTTLLRCLAGLEPRARGRLVVGGETWQDDAARVFVPAWRRAVGYVTQDAGLFPHLDVRGNLRFGERRVPSAERRLAFADVVAWLGLEPLLGRRPDSLSGGERQRVAIGRALLASPRLLLLDEPLSALDAANRTRILPYLETLPPRLSAPVVFVSHSLQEVARLCEHMVWLEAGRIRASGPVHELLPQVDASTEDEGLSAVLAGRVLQHDPVHELTEVAVAGGTLFVRRLHAAPGAAVRVQILARDVSVALDPELRASILNVLRARIVAVHAARGRAVLRLVTTGGAFLLARITTKSLAALGLAEGTEVFARMKSVGVVGGAGPDG